MELMILYIGMLLGNSGYTGNVKFFLTLEQPHSQFDCFSKFETQCREHLSSDILHILRLLFTS